jgi:hypothetical protein
MRPVIELRNQIRPLLKQYDDEAQAEVLEFLENYTSDTSYDIYVITYSGERLPYMVGELPYDIDKNLVAGLFVLANPSYYTDSDTPQYESVELEFNFGKHKVIHDVQMFRLYYIIDGKVYGYKY